jgi:hypothetical protein
VRDQAPIKRKKRVEFCDTNIVNVKISKRKYQRKKDKEQLKSLEVVEYVEPGSPKNSQSKNSQQT